MNLRLDIAYDGTPFHGFARQPDVRTVQGEVEAALSRLWSRPVTTVGAGRTDAGVHAVGQVVSTAVPDDADAVRVRDAINMMCRPSIAAWRCARVATDFHARFSARSRTYLYAILDGELPDPFLSGTTLYHPQRLDIDAMNEAAGHLVGARDFASFGRAGDGESSERTLFELRAWRRGSLVRIRARANAFLQQMVRSLAGTLIQVGEGKRSPGEMVEVLEAKDRAAAGPVAAPHALCLVSVEYDEGWSEPFDPLA